MKEVLLVFNVTDPVKLSKMRKALLPLKIRAKKVEKQDYMKAVGFLAGDKVTEGNGKAYDGEELPGEMIVMAGFTDSRLNELLAAFRKNGMEQIACKAVLTPTNRTWNALELYEELRKEHEAMQGK